MNNIGRVILASCVLLSGAGSVAAASFTGKVTLPDGAPAYGAMLTVFSADHAQRETVYTAADGTYAIVTPYSGTLTLRARLANYADATTSLDASQDAVGTADLQLANFADDQAESDALSASAHNAKLQWQQAGDRRAFVSQCNYCHQIGNSTTRAPRSHELWMATITKMEGYFAMVTRAQKILFASVLEQGFDGKPVIAKHDYGATADLARAKIEEWNVGDSFSFIHDMDVAEDGKFYGTDEGHDKLWILDPATGKVETADLPPSGLPRGGTFSGMHLAIGIFTGSHGPHSMGQTSDGRIWITNSLSSTLMSFDPKTRQFKVYPVPGDALYPHTVRVDRNDVVWFTIVASNQLGRFDPKTEQMTVMRLPHNGFFRWVTDMLFPTLLRISSWFPDKVLLLDFTHARFLGYQVAAFPYGIDINPKDGSVWYAKLYANKIGRVDPQTLEVREYDTPMSGPRRPRFDKDGIFWIPSFDEGGLMRFDPATGTFESYKIPGVAPGEYETPYALNVYRPTGDVWLAPNNSDRIVKFTPATKTFQSYPSPTRVTVLRDFSFTKDGKVCSSQSNLPAYAIEGGVPSYLCIDPTGGERDRAALAAVSTPPAVPR
ncbi:MAG TPA: carboxypeptidase regulatory-like domain-containing protein [Steroidobacteraceae bacterium]|nr:carboxypeptidase regulatory-like domain-containing protein [Steroidobacteraceae bacterium]